MRSFVPLFRDEHPIPEPFSRTRRIAAPRTCSHPCEQRRTGNPLKQEPARQFTEQSGMILRGQNPKSLPRQPFRHNVSRHGTARTALPARSVAALADHYVRKQQPSPAAGHAPSPPKPVQGCTTGRGRIRRLCRPCKHPETEGLQASPRGAALRITVSPPPEAWQRNGPSPRGSGRVPPAKPAFTPGPQPKSATRSPTPKAQCVSPRSVSSTPPGRRRSADASRKAARIRALPDAAGSFVFQQGFHFRHFSLSQRLRNRRRTHGGNGAKRRQTHCQDSRPEL